MVDKRQVNAEEAIAALNAFGIEIDAAAIEAFLDAYERGEAVPGKSPEYAAAKATARQAYNDAEEEMAEVAGYKMTGSDYLKIALSEPEEVDKPEPEPEPPSDPIRRALWEGIYHNTPTQASTTQPEQTKRVEDISDPRELLKLAFNSNKSE